LQYDYHELQYMTTAIRAYLFPGLCLFGVALVLPAQQAGGKPETPSKAGDAGKAGKKEPMASLEGQVVNSVTGDPLKKVTVMLAKTRGGSPITAETDDTGKFRFQEIAAGRYLLFGERTGFARQAYGARANAISGTALVFSAGQEVKDLRFKLSPSAVISGKVLDDDGEGMPNATVMALKTMYDHGKKQFLPLGAAQTNDVGEFRLGNLKGGKYVISATFRNLGMGLAGASSGKPPADKPEPAYTTTFYPNSNDPVAASPIDIGVGAEMRGMDIRMTKVKAFRVKGKLSDAQNKPTVVFLTPKGQGITGLVTRNMALAQQDGGFEFKGVAPGSYLLNATGTDGLTAVGTLRPVTVTDQHIEGLILETTPGGELPGVLVIEGPSKDKVNLKDIKVVLASTEIMNISPPLVTVGEDGKFTFKNVAPDHYLVSVQSGPETLYTKSVKFGTVDATEDGVDLSNGVTGSIEIALSQEGALVDGRVVGEDGNPVAGATVVLIPKSRRYSLFKEMTTDQQGSFSFKGVTPGDYKLLSWEDIEQGAYQDPEFLKQFESKAEEASLKENTHKVVSLNVIAAESK
jgi:protocatechuate 3,4-dioxygenase beta subunit